MKKIQAREIFDYDIPILDVRSPSEYNHAHIPGAFSLPLFSDEERAIVGKIYKHNGRQHAIKAGVGFFNMSQIIKDAEKIIKDFGGEENKNQVIIHCWRGGMRSGAVAWLLNLYGYDVMLVEGGYKAFRNIVLSNFTDDFNFVVIGGFTGSNKTGVLSELKKHQLQTIDLEDLANHKGSAFGSLGQPSQPSQEMFENLLAKELFNLKIDEQIFIEDESQRLGKVNIPNLLWQTLINKPVCFIEIPFKERLDFLLEEYGKFDNESLASSITRIQKRLGPLETKTALKFLEEDNKKECFKILLNYYDKVYIKALNKKDPEEKIVTRISFDYVDEKEVAKVLMNNFKIQFVK